MKTGLKQYILTGVGLDFPEGYAPTNQAVEIAKGLNGIGLEPLLIPVGKSKDPTGDTLGRHEGVQFKYLYRQRNVRRWLSHLPGSGLIIPVLNAFRFGIYLSNHRRSIAGVFDLSNHTLALGMMVGFCKVLDIPYTYFLWEEVFGHRIHRQSKVAIRMLHQLIAFFEKPLLYGVILRLCDRLCFLTPSFSKLMQRWGYPEKQLFAFPVVKTIHSTEAEKELSRYHSEDPFLVYSGTINTQKDEFLRVLEAMLILKKDYPDLKFRIFGDLDESDSKAKILEYAKTIGVEEQLLFEGWQPRNVLKSAQEQAVALLVLKKKCEFNRFNFPSRVLEYMQAKTPMIMSDHPNHLGVFVDKGTALLVDPGNAEMIADSIRFCLEREAATNAITENAIRLLKTRFDAFTNLKKLLGEIRSDSAILQV